MLQEGQKEMSDEAKGFCIAVICAAITISSIFWSISYYMTTTTKAAIEAGLEQVSIPGVSGYVWGKKDERRQ